MSSESEILIEDVPRRLRFKLESLMEDYLEAGDKIDEKKLEQDDLKGEIEKLRAQVGADKIKWPDGPSVVLRPGKSSFDKARFVMLMADSGIDPGLTKSHMEAATKKGEPYTEIDRGKRGKKNDE